MRINCDLFITLRWYKPCNLISKTKITEKLCTVCFSFVIRVIQEHIVPEPASVSPAHSVGMLPVEVTCQAVGAVIPESDRVLLELPRNGRLLVLEAVFLKRINSRKNRHSNIHVRYLYSLQYFDNLYHLCII